MMRHVEAVGRRLIAWSRYYSRSSPHLPPGWVAILGIWDGKSSEWIVDMLRSHVHGG